MAEHLFKLKKDCKTVGYARIMPSIQGDFHLYVVKSRRKTLQRWRASSRKHIEADSIHPFVIKDKDGKDVFANDEIKALILWPTIRTPKIITGKVDWRNETLNWVLYHTPNTPECIEIWKLQDIELIEDKNNG